MENETINSHIQKNLDELDGDTSNSQRRRFLEDEVDRLNNFKLNNPNHSQMPTPFELYCDENPDSPECRIFDV